jgi:hypothetical protein
VRLVLFLNPVLAAVAKVDSATCDVTLDSKENAVKLLHGIEINDVEYNVSLIFSDTTVVSFMKLPSYIEDEDIISKLQAKGIKLVYILYTLLYGIASLCDLVLHICYI